MRRARRCRRSSASSTATRLAAARRRRWGQAMARFNLEIPRAHLAQFVAYMCDQDGDGKVDYQEPRRRSAATTRRTAVAPPRARGGFRICRALRRGASRAWRPSAAGKTSAGADADNSGTRDFEEFKSLMRRAEPNGNTRTPSCAGRIALFDADMSGRIDKDRAEGTPRRGHALHRDAQDELRQGLLDPSRESGSPATRTTSARRVRARRERDGEDVAAEV